MSQENGIKLVLFNCTPEKNIYLDGNITLDESYMTENAFSSFSTSSGQDVSNPVLCNIKATTHKPLHIKTPSLDAQSSLEIGISNSLQNPIVSGNVTILSGIIPFPYKNLLITHGNIYLIHGQQSTLDLVAKNRVKMYDITLHITGDIQNPEIYTSSWPELTQEEIFSLLITGHETTSLQTVMPAIMVNRIQESFSSLALLTKPLSNIHIIPTLTSDNTHALCSAIEIDVGDNWRALVQKNLTVTEFPLLEIEYAFSDNMHFKAIRNEIGNLQANLEMRWNFG